jgi:beta-hydroxylase
VRTPRQAVLRLGKDLRPAVDRVIARYSAVGDPAVFEPARFSFVAPLEAHWETIRTEARAVRELHPVLPEVKEISPDHARIAPGRGWRSYFLVGYGERRERACRRCPQTARLLEDVPGLETAFFSILEPGQELVPHCGPTKAILTWHLALEVPRARERCRITIAGRPYAWEAGRSLLFDDTYRHSVHNDTDQERVVLLMHVRRPVRFPGSLVARGFLSAIERSPFVRDARRNQDAWDEAIEAAGREGAAR